ncbi:MAG: hypothetical protein LBL42_03420 [Tannerella sp.]|jgi:hypothetical protein|nr:hypothetical protein [Tannerella sp.]
MTDKGNFTGQHPAAVAGRLLSGSMIVLLCLFCLSRTGLCAAPVAFETGEIKATVRYYTDTEVKEELTFRMKNGSRATDRNGAEWELGMSVQPVDGQPDATDYLLSWKLLKGEAREAAVGVDFVFNEWTAREFVFVPAIVYAGNRFDIKDLTYPPFWYDSTEWRPDMPTTTTVQPTLGKHGKGKIELNTGNASTPLMAFHSPDRQRGWMVQTTQGSRFGNHGLSVEEEEDAQRGSATFSITAPAMRKTMAMMGALRPSGDRAPDWKAGDTLSIRFRVHAFPAPELLSLYRRFMEVRKDLNASERRDILPFSKAWELMYNFYERERWQDSLRHYSLNGLWQLGWGGGGQCTLPLMMRGTPATRQRVMSNLDFIFSKTQTPSGFFYACREGGELVGIGKSFRHDDVTFIRSQGDWLYMSQHHFRQIVSEGGEVPPQWLSAIRNQADAFVRMWEKHGQFGQFLDVQTGELLIGGSTAGAIVCGGLALASQTFATPRYLEVAAEAAEKYHRDFVLNGYTSGGPAEILSAPDSESAFGLFEALMALYGVDGDRKWLSRAADLLPLCASWTVSYDYCFPAGSVMNQLDARSCGSVWASVSNKHSAPGICTWSGDCLLKYYRATGDRRAIELLADIAHDIPQYISRAGRPIGNMPPGGICERVNLSDWEGKDNVGGNIFGSCTWSETTVLLTVTQLPGVYVRPETGFHVAFDHVRTETVEPDGDSGLLLRLTNLTEFSADISVFSESERQARQTPFAMTPENTQTVHLEPNETKVIRCGSN